MAIDHRSRRLLRKDFVVCDTQSLECSCANAVYNSAAHILPTLFAPPALPFQTPIKTPECVVRDSDNIEGRGRFEKRVDARAAVHPSRRRRSGTSSTNNSSRADATTASRWHVLHTPATGRQSCGRASGHSTRLDSTRGALSHSIQVRQNQSRCVSMSSSSSSSHMQLARVLLSASPSARSHVAQILSFARRLV